MVRRNGTDLVPVGRWYDEAASMYERLCSLRELCSVLRELLYYELRERERQRTENHFRASLEETLNQTEVLLDSLNNLRDMASLAAEKEQSEPGR